MIVGFTGTKEGMTCEQHFQVAKILGAGYREGVRVFHHGDCVGADFQAHQIAREMGYYIIIHPPLNPDHQAFCQGDSSCIPLPYLKRNKAIVDACHIMIAAPKNAKEQLRSGTWATVRYSRKKNKEINIIDPAGIVLVENRPLIPEFFD